MRDTSYKIAKKNLSSENYKQWLSQVKNAYDSRKNGKTAKAIEYYKKALKIYENDFLSLFQLGRIEISRENFKKSIVYFDKCLKIKKNDVQSLYWKAFSYFEQQNLKSAFPIYKKILTLTKKHEETWHDLGHCYLVLKKYKLAEQCFKKQINLIRSPDPHDWEICGNSLFLQKKYQNAAKYYQLAIKKDPERISAIASLGGAQYNLGRISNAVEYLEKAITIKPNDDYSLHLLGHCYSELNRHLKAIEYFRKEIRTRNFSEDTWYQIGNSYYELKKYQNALEALRKSLKSDKNDIDTWIKIGEVYSALKKYDKSAQCFQKVEILKGSKLEKKKPVKKYDSEGTLPKDDKSKKENKQKKVFVVHGQDASSLRTLNRFLEHDLKLTTLILSKLPPRGRYLMEKIENYLSESGFVVVLLTPDDIGFPKKKMNEEEFRARQNVILEYGLSRGKLGRENVCLLCKDDVKIPTDMLGVNFLEMDKKGTWKKILVEDMKESNMQVKSIG